MQRCATCMYPQNRFTPHPVRQWHHNMAVKASRTQQCLVQDIKAVCRSQHDDCLARVKAIEFDQQLIECLLTLIIGRDMPRSLAAHSIDFIQKDNARRGFTGLVEEVTYPLGTKANIHFDELRSTHTEERNVSLTRNGPC